MIYIITRIWHGGKIEAIEAHKTEEKAREAAGKYITMTQPFHISIFIAKLVEEKENG